MTDERIILAEKCLQMAELAAQRLRERESLAVRLAEAEQLLGNCAPWIERVKPPEGMDRHPLSDKIHQFLLRRHDWTADSATS